MQKKIETRLNEAFSDCFEQPIETELTPATKESFGHYQCNSAMKLAKQLQMAPVKIAQMVVEKISQDPIFEKIEVAGPGFLNLTLSASFLSERLDRVVRDEHLGIERPEKPQTIVFDFSAPNIAKEMHVGHLRSTIIGDCLARLFEFLGHRVVRLNHVGDWGTAFGMLIAYMQEKKLTEMHDLSELMAWYKESKALFDADETFKAKSREAVVRLQAHDPQSVAIWEQICETSRKAFAEVYKVLDVKLEERGESFYNPMLEDLVEDLEKKGLIQISQGAKCVFHEGMRIPLMVQKSDGGYNYDTTDMAAMLHRIEEEGADRIVIVTDAGQRLHFELIYRTAVRAGYLDPKKVRFDHVTFGLVLGPDGKKFRTRSGETEKLVDLLCKAVDKAREILEERGEPNEELAHILGIDAIKYADLSCNRVSDYVFSYEKMLRFEGNTAAFILYSYVRIAGIKRKVGVDQVDMDTHISLEHPSEVSLGLHLLRFSDLLDQLQEELLPNLLTDYLYTLAQKFNAFFRDCRVEGDEMQSERLLLCEAAAQTMKVGLHLLGLRTVERM